MVCVVDVCLVLLWEMELEMVEMSVFERGEEV